MSYRRNLVKPAAGLWLIVLMADLVLVASAVGIAVLLASVASAAVVAAGVWLLLRRSVANHQSMAAPIPARTRARRIS